MAKQKPAPEARPEEATVFPVADLVTADPSVFGVPSELMAGALHGRKEATKEEAAELLKEFREKPVHKEPKGEGN
jgi:hypothetical protein